uniref:Uncharacterized protein n=1 Tax=Picea glauca TaxID=3330 RepID=A0A101LVT4_PICGL|nr:hypothetical protein ABT39_MTgene1752 [Picea glauca]QHR88414.1 hypothetical protein Q903MT_gene2427 [Picea sitchensis]
MAMLDSLARHDPTAMVRYVLTRPDLATLEHFCRECGDLTNPHNPYHPFLHTITSFREVSSRTCHTHILQISFAPRGSKYHSTSLHTQLASL